MISFEFERRKGLIKKIYWWRLLLDETYFKQISLELLFHKLGNFSPYDLPKGEIEREALVDCYWGAHHHGHYFQHLHLQIARESVSQIATVWIINVKLVWNSMKIPQGSEYWNGICIKKGFKGLGITEKNEKKSRFLLKREYDSHRSFSRVIFCRF